MGLDFALCISPSCLWVSPPRVGHPINRGQFSGEGSSSGPLAANTHSSWGMVAWRAPKQSTTDIFPIGNAMTVRGNLSRETQPGTEWGSEEAKRAGMIKRLMRSDSEHENGTVGRIIAFNSSLPPGYRIKCPCYCGGFMVD